MIRFQNVQNAAVELRLPKGVSTNAKQLEGQGCMHRLCKDLVAPDLRNNANPTPKGHKAQVESIYISYKLIQRAVHRISRHLQFQQTKRQILRKSYKLNFRFMESGSRQSSTDVSERRDVEKDQHVKG